jgi:xylulokinase
VADATNLPVEVVAVPEGGARGAAFFARLAAGLETSLDDSARWAGVGHRIEPDPRWVRACEPRYQRFSAVGTGREGLYPLAD